MLMRRPELLVKMRGDAEKIFRAAVASVDPYEAVKRHVKRHGEKLMVGGGRGGRIELDLRRFENIYLVGGGKATAPMAKAMEDLLEGRISRGLINVKYGFTEELRYTKTTEAGHPMPDETGVKGTKKILDLLRESKEKDLVISLISGGGSALLPHPADGISLEEKQTLTRSMLSCGATIGEINAVRKHISFSKGGQMARLAYRATTLNLMLSDVIGDRPDVIASGPFVPDSSTFEEALRVIDRYRLEEIPSSIRSHLSQGAAGEISETPKEGDPVFEKVHHFIIGSNLLALEGAAKAGARLGYRPLILSSMIEGETREVARVHTAIIKEMVASGQPVPPPACLISGGETTVTLRGEGIGGRNQEFCLAAALEIQDLPLRVVALSAGTDGNDGPTEAAGAIIDPLTCKIGKEIGLDAWACLEENDSYSFFKRVGELLVTGPTNTNVMDVRVMLVCAPPSIS
jgi:hydroxypyruvate reductase